MMDIKRVEVSCKTDKARVILYIDIENEIYYSEIYNYEFENEDRVQPIPSKPLSELKTKDIIEYFEKLKSIAREFQISDHLVFASYDAKDFERFANSVYFTTQKVKKKVRG